MRTITMTIMCDPGIENNWVMKMSCEAFGEDHWCFTSTHVDEVIANTEGMAKRFRDSGDCVTIIYA